MTTGWLLTTVLLGVLCFHISTALEKLTDGINPIDVAQDDDLDEHGLVTRSSNPKDGVLMPSRRTRQFGRRIKTRQNGAYQAETSRHHVDLKKIDVDCFPDGQGMAVSLEFLEPFNGIVYSKGQRNNPNCVYVLAGSNQNVYQFNIPAKECGTKPSPGECREGSCGFGRAVENTIIIQTDEQVLESWDLARKLSCPTSLINDKTVFFKPIEVDMLEVVSVPSGNSGTIDCWMDIQRGTYPQISPIDGIIKIGEALTLLIYIKDSEGKYDVRIRDCWAYATEDYESPETTKIQLTDAEGCPRKKKLIGFWNKNVERKQD
ncbi:uncharacterized protein LOC103511193 [Diaphorina citri]|uniref:Uncharacterized protein LOC103511193 n=1 Tax=Diaphorina citri TaxID=121845 RepID=A0A3Q0J272_DIACI|nr:uncharacterized protein LOC103511193 [Diaphorina citri]